MVPELWSLSCGPLFLLPVLMELPQTVISIYLSPFLVLSSPFHVTNTSLTSGIPHSSLPRPSGRRRWGLPSSWKHFLRLPCTPSPSSESPFSLAAPSWGSGSRGSGGSILRLRRLLSPALCPLHSRATLFSLVLQSSPSAGGWNICPGCAFLPNSRPVDRSASCMVCRFWKAPPASPAPARRAPHPLGISGQPSPFWRAARTSFLMWRGPQFWGSPKSPFSDGLMTHSVGRSHPLFPENISESDLCLFRLCRSCPRTGL